MNKFKGTFYVILALTIILTMGSVAQSQDIPFAIDNMPNVVGISGGIAPDYWGSDDS